MIIWLSHLQTIKIVKLKGAAIKGNEIDSDGLTWKEAYGTRSGEKTGKSENSAQHDVVFVYTMHVHPSTDKDL